MVNGSRTDVGRVSAVYPAIGMVDVEFPHTSTRLPVEDLIIMRPDSDLMTPLHENVPGGAGQAAMVSEGAPQDNLVDIDLDKVASRVATAFVKKSIYWSGKGRKYRCTRVENQSNSFHCPKSNCDGILKPAIYKRVDGVSIKLMGCPKCMFLIKTSDIVEAPFGEEV
jgi:hypothetical protein